MSLGNSIFLGTDEIKKKIEQLRYSSPPYFRSKHSALGNFVSGLAVYHDELYAATFEDGVIYKFDGHKWVVDYDLGAPSGLWDFYVSETFDALYIGGYSANPLAQGGILLVKKGDQWKIAWAEYSNAKTTNTAEVSSIVEYNGQVVAIMGAGSSPPYALVSSDGVNFNMVNHGISLASGEWINVAGILANNLYLFKASGTQAQIYQWDIVNPATLVLNFPGAYEPYPRPNVPLVDKYLVVFAGIRTSSRIPVLQPVFLFDGTNLIDTDIRLPVDPFYTGSGSVAFSNRVFGDGIVVPFVRKAVGIIYPLDKRIEIWKLGPYFSVELFGNNLVLGRGYGWTGQRSPNTIGEFKTAAVEMIPLSELEPIELKPLEENELYIYLSNFINYIIGADAVLKSSFDQVLVKRVRVEPLTTNGTASAWAFTDPGPLNEFLFNLVINPTYITYGGLDRSGITIELDRKIQIMPNHASLIRPSANANAQLYIWLRYGNPFFKDVCVPKYVSNWSGVSALANNNVGPYSTTTSAGTEVVIDQVQFIRPFNIMKLYNRVGYYISAATTGSSVNLYWSSNGTTWNLIQSITNLPTTLTFTDIVAYNLQGLQYLRLTANSGATTSTVTVYVQKAFLWATANVAT